MALTMFKAFISTVTRFYTQPISSTDRWLVDPTTGAITGVQSDGANGPDARFVPVDITPAQLLNPDPLMIADLDATYRLNQPPYPRYMSDGTQLVPLGAAETEIVVPKGFNVIYYAPLTIATPQELVVEGQAQVRSYPA